MATGDTLTSAATTSRSSAAATVNLALSSSRLYAFRRTFSIPLRSCRCAGRISDTSASHTWHCSASADCYAVMGVTQREPLEIVVVGRVPLTGVDAAGSAAVGADHYDL